MKICNSGFMICLQTRTAQACLCCHVNCAPRYMNPGIPVVLTGALLGRKRLAFDLGGMGATGQATCPFKCCLNLTPLLLHLANTVKKSKFQRILIIAC